MKDPTAKQAMMLMGFLGMALLNAFKVFLETFQEWRSWTVRKTKKLLCWVIELGVCDEVPQVALPP